MSLKKVFDFIKFNYVFCKVKTVFYSVKLNIYYVYMVKTENLLFYRIHNAWCRSRGAADIYGVP